MNETIRTILSRRSIRKYKEEQIKDEELQTILEAAKYAPSGMNQQPWHFTVIQNKAALGKVNEACKAVMQKSDNKDLNVMYNAPTLIIVSGDPKAVTPQFDCPLALENMFLAAESIGIGSCWINAVSTAVNSLAYAALKNELGIPQDYNVFATGSFGYKASEQPKAAPRKENTVNIIK